MSKISVSVTGHRPKDLFGYDGKQYRVLFSRIQYVFKTFLDRCDTLEVVTGGAQGVDQIAFWSAHTLKNSFDVHTVLAIPFKGQERKWKETGTFGQKEYRNIVSLADEVVYVLTKYVGTTSYVLRDQYMVNHSDVLLSVLDPSRLEGTHSGTLLTTKYALEQDKLVVHIDPFNDTQEPKSIYSLDEVLR